MNLAIIVGRLMKEPTITQNDNSFTVTFTLGTSQGPYSEYHSIIAWRKNVDKYKSFNEGDEILVEGSLNSYSYIDQKGNKQWKTNIKADKITKMYETSPKAF